MQQDPGPEDAQHRLHELDLAHLRDRPDREAPIPGEEAEEHADHREIGEREPLHRSRLRRSARERDRGQRDHQRRRQHERPRHGLPRPELPREQPALRVADRGGEHGAEQQQIGRMESAEAAVLQRRESDGDDSTQRGEEPERPRGPLLRAQHRGHGGRRGEQSDHDRTVTRRRRREREGREQGEAGDDAGGDHRQPEPLPHPRRLLAGERERDPCEDRRHDGPAGSDEQRRQPADGDPRERHREGERHDAEKAPAEAGAGG